MEEITVGGILLGVFKLVAIQFLWWPLLFALLLGAWHFFERMGRPGWAAFVPGWNVVELLRAADLPPRWLALLLLPVANVFVGLQICGRLARRFGRGPEFALGLFFLPPVFLSLLGLQVQPSRS